MEFLVLLVAVIILGGAFIALSPALVPLLVIAIAVYGSLQKENK